MTRDLLLVFSRRNLQNPKIASLFLLQCNPAKFNPREQLFHCALNVACKLRRVGSFPSKAINLWPSCETYSASPL